MTRSAAQKVGLNVDYMLASLLGGMLGCWLGDVVNRTVLLEGTIILSRVAARIPLLPYSASDMLRQVTSMPSTWSTVVIVGAAVGSLHAVLHGQALARRQRMKALLLSMLLYYVGDAFFSHAIPFRFPSFEAFGVLGTLIQIVGFMLRSVSIVGLGYAVAQGTASIVKRCFD